MAFFEFPQQDGIHSHVVNTSHIIRIEKVQLPAVGVNGSITVTIQGVESPLEYRYTSREELDKDYAAIIQALGAKNIFEAGAGSIYEERGLLEL